MEKEEDTEVSEPTPSERPSPATGERDDHEATVPGVALPDEEPEPGEHPNP